MNQRLHGYRIILFVAWKVIHSNDSTHPKAHSFDLWWSPLPPWCQNNWYFRWSKHSSVLLPPHTTNILQPLDVVAFGSMKVHFSRITDTASLFSLCLKQSLNVSKRNFTPIFKDAYKRTWSIAVIKNRFRKCGVYLFGSNAIETTNLKVVFLLHKSQIFPRTQQKTSIHLHQLRVYKAAHTWHVKHYFNPVTFQHL